MSQQRAALSILFQWEVCCSMNFQIVFCVEQNLEMTATVCCSSMNLCILEVLCLFLQNLTPNLSRLSTSSDKLLLSCNRGISCEMRYYLQMHCLMLSDTKMGICRLSGQQVCVQDLRPAQSTPTLQSWCDCSIGSCPSSWVWGFAWYHWQVVHSRDTNRTTWWPPIMWNLWNSEDTMRYGPACSRQECSDWVSLVTGCFLGKTIGWIR